MVQIKGPPTRQRVTRFPKGDELRHRQSDPGGNCASQRPASSLRQRGSRKAHPSSTPQSPARLRIPCRGARESASRSRSAEVPHRAAFTRNLRPRMSRVSLRCSPVRLRMFCPSCARNLRLRFSHHSELRRISVFGSGETVDLHFQADRGMPT
jgi:hypothetical protein